MRPGGRSERLAGTECVSNGTSRYDIAGKVSMSAEHSDEQDIAVSRSDFSLWLSMKSSL